ncbi:MULTISPECIES: UDP-N-acetylmuramoyl-tripeptide--D-alanyl-D-alanine ligase [Spirulina sp. CCY15215]|uniref:UDP-N-acetylmuramoyl-tripeptide--D-alanyl-D- alanine ligase n=1 Tax=Spirulina sp. CCY15215 TaxID=2767591 RepID=UPI0019526908|nr:UDP-N-acetylmuramoyl-tripeptide--D-alanyl-D-alanine ligase [Spirulina major]
MSFTVSLAQLPEILEVSRYLPNLSPSVLLTGINTDTRTLQPGEAFLALQGDAFDGHHFLAAAVDKGAKALIIARDPFRDLPDTIPQLQVKDTLRAYQRLGNWWRDRFEIPIIGITGSVGKTTTKELIASVLATRGQVLKTLKNYNNEIGVPKTLLGLSENDDYAVIEMAMRGEGQIAELTEIASPTIGVITNVGTAHIGLLGSREAIARAKCELLATMPDNSIAVLNADNELLMQTAATVWRGETITYGLEKGDLRGELLDFQTLRVEGKSFPLPLLGRHNASNYLAALAVAKVLDLDWQPLLSGLSVELPKGRAQRYQLGENITILDETYNAGFESMVAALRLLKETPAQRHLAVLGTMKELGDKSAELHQQVGEVAQELQLDRVLILADDRQAEAIAIGSQNIPTVCLTTHDKVVAELKQTVQPGDCLLFKASNSVGLNRVIEQLRTEWQE